MIKSFFATTLFICNILIPVPGQNNRGWNFHFPLGIEAVVSGSFGELRGAHFHSGVDFATGGRIGLPVYSVDDGHVSRVVVSPTGYGKALYIEHPNGYTSVYAHLHDFAPKIETIVTNLQYRQESFAIEQYFRPGEIVVSRAELIGFTGNTGSSSGPHLHFEIRETDRQRPVNVHYFNLPVKDDVPPVIKAICIYPLDANSRVNGKNEPLYLPVVRGEGGHFLRGNPRVTASGTIGVGIETLDYFTGSWRECGVYRIVLRVDDKDWFESRLDGILFSQTRYLLSHIDFAARQKHNRVIQKSFLDDNNRLDIYRVTPERGRVKMEDGVARRFNYQVSDAAGNISELRFTIHATSAPVTTGVPANSHRMLDATRPHDVDIDGFRVKFPANSFYTDVPALFEVTANRGIGIGKHFSVLHPSIPVHNFFEIIIPVPGEIKSQKGLVGARLNNKNGLVFAGGRQEGSRWVIRTREPGIYCLAIDTVAPAIGLLHPPPNRDYTGRDAIRVEIKDNFSGIREFRATMNGKWALFEHDPKNNVIIGFFSKLRIEKGMQHELEITATDNAANTQVLRTRFFY